MHVCTPILFALPILFVPPHSVYTPHSENFLFTSLVVPGLLFKMSLCLLGIFLAVPEVEVNMKVLWVFFFIHLDIFNRVKDMNQVLFF